MADGFTAKATLDQAPVEVWAYLTDLGNAGEWMRGIDRLEQVSPGPLQVGSELRFISRGKERETRVTAMVPCERLALTSTQGGITATYTYLLAPDGDGTEITLEARCTATGLWKLVHPLIVFAMKQSDASHVRNFKTAMNRRRSTP